MEKMGELLERLASDLQGLGGWPEWAAECVLHRGASKAMFYDGDGCFQAYPKFPDIRFKEEADIERIVYREMYEAALAASKTEWDGEGLPPVGCECEGKQLAQLNWNKFKVVAIENGHVFGFWNDNVSTGLDSMQWEFRPIRSEADKKKYATIEEMLSTFFGAPPVEEPNENDRVAMAELYDAIKSGKIVID